MDGECISVRLKVQLPVYCSKSLVDQFEELQTVFYSTHNLNYIEVEEGQNSAAGFSLRFQKFEQQGKTENQASFEEAETLKPQSEDLQVTTGVPKKPHGEPLLPEVPHDEHDAADSTIRNNVTRVSDIANTTPGEGVANAAGVTASAQMTGIPALNVK